MIISVKNVTKLLKSEKCENVIKICEIVEMCQKCEKCAVVRNLSKIIKLHQTDKNAFKWSDFMTMTKKIKMNDRM